MVSIPACKFRSAEDGIPVGNGAERFHDLGCIRQRGSFIGVNVFPGLANIVGKAGFQQQPLRSKRRLKGVAVV